ncbi:endonuclease III [Halobacteriales archaeon QH_10_65_19]|nr:MAG: endonuclease III [Halobacteriales archaeon QH_10_65_19]
MGTPRDNPDRQMAEIIEWLHKEYPDTGISLRFSNRLELLVAVILSAQCTDERVNSVTEELFETYQTPEDYAEADQEQLTTELNSITYYNNKAEYIRAACQQIIDEHDSEVPDTMSALTDLPGVGRKTANVVLQHGHDVVEGVVVDTHVQRLTRRLGVIERERPEAIEAELMELVPEAEWQELTHLLISHGRAVCSARSPDCEDCVLEDICPSSTLDSDVDLASGKAW